MVKRRKDFLTGALIDRAVQEASSRAWEMSIGGDESGIQSDHLARSLDNQIMSVVHQLTPQNIHSYLDLPDGTKVTGVRRLTQ